MKRSKQDQESTKKLVIEAAGYLFETQGYYHTSLDDIAKKVGVSRGTIYGNFSGKCDLLEHIFSYNNNKFESLLEIDARQTKSASQKLKNIMKIYFSLLIEDQNFRQIERLQVFETFIGKEAELLEKISLHDIQSLETYVEEIYQEGLLNLEFNNNFSAQPLAQAFMLLFSGIIFSYLGSDNFIENQKVSLASLDILFKSIH